MLEQIKRVVDVQVTHIHNVQIVNGDGQNDRLETCPFAGVTLTFTHKALNVLAHKLAVGLFMAPFQVRNHTFVGRIVSATAAKFDRVFLQPGAVQYFFKVLFRQSLDRNLQAKAMRRGNFGQSFHIPSVAINAVIGANRPLGNCEIRIEHQAGIDFESATEARTNRTGTLGRVKAKQPRL